MLWGSDIGVNRSVGGSCERRSLSPARVLGALRLALNRPPAWCETSDTGQFGQVRVSCYIRTVGSAVTEPPRRVAAPNRQSYAGVRVPATRAGLTTQPGEEGLRGPPDRRWR